MVVTIFISLITVFHCLQSQNFNTKLKKRKKKEAKWLSNFVFWGLLSWLDIPLVNQLKELELLIKNYEISTWF